MTTLERLRSAVGIYDQLCPVRCADLRAVLEAVDRLKDLVSEMGERNYFDRKSGNLRRNGAYTQAVKSLEQLEGELPE